MPWPQMMTVTMTMSSFAIAAGAIGVVVGVISDVALLYCSFRERPALAGYALASFASYLVGEAGCHFPFHLG